MIDLQVNNDVIDLLSSTCTSVSPIVLTHARKDICGSDKSGQFVKIWESKTGDEAEATYLARSSSIVPTYLSTR